MTRQISIIPLKLKFFTSFKTIIFLLFLIILSLTIFLIYQVNSYSETVYFINRTGQRIERLSQENKILEIDLAKANSLVNINQYLDNFEKAENITYIKVLEGTALAQ